MADGWAIIALPIALMLVACWRAFYLDRETRAGSVTRGRIYPDCKFCGRQHPAHWAPNWAAGECFDWGKSWMKTQESGWPLP